jgi:hypothetical protein
MNQKLLWADKRETKLKKPFTLKIYIGNKYS